MIYGMSSGMMATTWGALVIWSIVTIAIGTWVGSLRGRAVAGFWLTLWLSVFGIIIVALLPRPERDMRDTGVLR